MKIAFIGTLALSHGLGDQIDYLEADDNLFFKLEKFDRILLQIDFSNPFSETISQTDGWAILRQILNEKHNQVKPIILTSWNKNLIHQTAILTIYQHEVSLNKLLSPFIQFYPLEIIFKNRNKLSDLFDAPLGETQAELMLRTDLEHNLFEPPVIHEYLHKFKDHVRQKSAFNSNEFIVELRPYINQFITQYLSYQGFINSLTIEEKISSFIEKTLPKSKDKENFIYQLNKLEELIEEALAELKAPPEILALTILYIDDNKKHFENLKEVLSSYNIQSFYASNQKDAITLIKEKEQDICAIICDFRFFEKDNRFSRKQGYHILFDLNIHFPEFKYAFLSDRIGLTDALPEEMRWSWPEFKKGEILDSQPHYKINFAESERIRTGLPGLLTFLELAEKERKSKIAKPEMKLDKR